MKNINCPFCNQILKLRYIDEYRLIYLCENYLCEIKLENQKIDSKIRFNLKPNGIITFFIIYLNEFVLSMNKYSTSIYEIKGLDKKFILNLEINMTNYINLNNIIESCNNLMNRLLKIKTFV